MELTVKDLVAGYGHHTILDGITIDRLTGGQVVGVLGPNGSGKTTLIKTIVGVKKMRSGRVELSGAPIPVRERHKKVGYVPQGLPESAALRAFETVLIASRREAVENPVEHTAEVMHSLGMDEYAHRYLSELSGGQRQLVALAQMMVGKPELMLLDEPTSALDLHHQLFVLDAVKRKAVREDSLGMVAIHDINLAARMCDQLVVLKNGHILAIGTPLEILTPELIREVYDVEADIVQHNGVTIVAARGLTNVSTIE